MNKLIKNKTAFIVACIGLAGGLIWSFETDFNIEPLILSIVSFIEVIAYFLIQDSNADNIGKSTNHNKQNVNVNVQVGNIPSTIEKTEFNISSIVDRSAIIDSMFTRTTILFIDDDKNFNIVKILKDSGWKKTKTVTDIKTLEVTIAKEADIIFVDINGVGKLLNLEYEGLDLALMLKQKYPNKKVIIYSANRNSNAFHQAWDVCDFKLEKNALPYQFQNLVEEYSIEIYKSR